MAQFLWSAKLEKDTFLTLLVCQPHLETRRNRKVKDISPFAFHRNFPIPSLTSFSHLAKYDFQGVEPALSRGCGHPGEQHVIAGMPAVPFSSVSPQVHSHKLPSSSCAP